ncbi:hypothetical protein PQX77_009705 [Marasmius sp. AFHP31]|nr:hypothetical protein PQX77_009705 [Marasmius sp. AFHP31]
MITYDNFSAWITIGGKTCEEYGVHTSEQTRTVTCWIAFEEGKEYQVNWMCNKFTAPVSIRVLVDGHSCGGMLLKAASDLPKDRRVQLTGMRTSHTTVARFTFSPLKTTDDDAFISTPDSPELGDIKLTFRNSQPTIGSGPESFLEAPAEKPFMKQRRNAAAIRHAILQANGNAPPPPPRSPLPTLPLFPPLSTRISTNKRSRPEHGSDEDVKPYVSKLKDEEDDAAELCDLRVSPHLGTKEIAAAKAEHQSSNETSASHRTPTSPPQWQANGPLFHLTNCKDYPPVTYVNWSKIYGDVFHFSIFGHHTVVLNSKAMFELLDKRSSNYSDRPDMPMAMGLMGWNWNLSLVRYSDWWRIHRRTFHQYFQPRIVSEYLPIQRTTTSELMRNLAESPDNFFKHVKFASDSTILQITYGYTLKQMDDPYMTLVEQAGESIRDAGNHGSFWVDYFPLLKHVPGEHI